MHGVGKRTAGQRRKSVRRLRQTALAVYDLKPFKLELGNIQSSRSQKSVGAGRNCCRFPRDVEPEFIGLSAATSARKFGGEVDAIFGLKKTTRGIPQSVKAPRRSGASVECAISRRIKACGARAPGNPGRYAAYAARPGWKRISGCPRSALAELIACREYWCRS